MYVFKQTISTSLDKHLRNNKDSSPHTTCSPSPWLYPDLTNDMHKNPGAAAESTGQIPYSQYTRHLRETCQSSFTTALLRLLTPSPSSISPTYSSTPSHSTKRPSILPCPRSSGPEETSE